MTTARRTARTALPAAAAALVLAGCSATNEMTTTLNYEPSDGIRITLEDVRMGNAMVITTGRGEPGTVVGYLTNSGEEPASVAVAVVDVATGVEEELGSVRVDAGQTVVIGPVESETGVVGEVVDLPVASVPEIPGAMVGLRLTSDAGTALAEVPVLDGTLPDYENVLEELGG